MSNTQNSRSQENILIVDDIPENLHFLGKILSEKGYKVRPTLDGEMALQFAKSTLPDLILLDIMMPEMGGYEVCSRLKVSSETQDIPVIFISALHEVFDKVKAFEVGGLDYITKPFQSEEILARVENQLRIRRLSKQLQQQKELLQTIFDHIPVMVALSDAKGQIQLVNRELESILGWSHSELKNVDLLAECYPEVEYRQQVLSHMIAATGKWQDFKTKIRDGSYVDTSWAFIQLSHGTSISIGQDITERKQAEEASVLEERNRMAREIHDTLAQAFTGIIISLESALRVMTTDPHKAQTRFIQARDLARTGLAEARCSVEALRPQLLTNGDLCRYLHRLVAQTKSFTGARIICSVMGTAYPLPQDVENNLLRIGQEALTNAIKHAKASDIHIELVYEPAQCVLRIKDNGQGFEISNTFFGNGFGLIGMTERAERIGAQLIIQSQFGQGTEVMVSINAYSPGN